MASPSILFTCQNKQEVDSIIPVIKRIREIKPGINISILSQDDLYSQGVSQYLQELGEEPIEIGLPVQLECPYTKLPYLKKLTIYKHTVDQIKFLPQKHDAIVCGVDGLPVRILSQYSNDTKIFQLIVSYYDGTTNAPDYIERIKRNGEYVIKYIISKILGYEFLNFPNKRAQSHDGLIFTPGEISRDELVKAGVDEDRIIVTGCPRFKPLFSAQKSFEGDIEYDLLYICSAFKLHGHNKLNELQESQVHDISRFCTNNGLKFAVRPHPRESTDKYKNLQNYESTTILDSSSELYPDIKRSCIVLTIMSTVAYESVLLSRPVITTHFPEIDIIEGSMISDHFSPVRSMEVFEKTIFSIKRSYEEYENLLDKQRAVAVKMIDTETLESDRKIAEKIVSYI